MYKPQATLQAARRTAIALAAAGTTLITLALPAVAAEPQIGSGIVAAQRYRAADNGSSDVKVVSAAGVAASSTQVTGAVPAAEHRAGANTADRHAMLTAADRHAMLTAADRHAMLAAADRHAMLAAADRHAMLAAADRHAMLTAADRHAMLTAADRHANAQTSDR